MSVISYVLDKGLATSLTSSRRTDDVWSSFQLRGSQILDAVRLHKSGFPESLTFGEFWRKFRVLGDEGAGKKKRQKSPGEMRSAVEELLDALDMDAAAVRIGNTQVINDRNKDCPQRDFPEKKIDFLRKKQKKRKQKNGKNQNHLTGEELASFALASGPKRGRNKRILSSSLALLAY